MANEPTDEAVSNVVDFSGADRATAVRYLKAKNGDVAQALNAIIDGEDISQAEAANAWDDTAFATNREGQPKWDNNNSVAFNDPSNTLRPLGTSGAPTRNPSPAPSFKQPNTKAEEDDDLAKAMAMSQNEMNGSFYEEIGVVDHDGNSTTTGFRTFGPATKDHYDSQNWALTVTGPSVHEATEVIPDPESSERKNIDGEPRFLKQLPSGDYTPNFITICHSIPAAREALLMRDRLRTQYGNDSDWWKGHPILLPRIVNTADQSPAEAEPTAEDELIAEVQRLIAALDVSARSYVSAEALLKTPAIENLEPWVANSKQMVKCFVEMWERIAVTRTSRPDLIGQLFHSVIGTTDPRGMTKPYLWVVEKALDIAPDMPVTLGEVLDDLLWNTNPDDEDIEYDNFIAKPAEVLVLKLWQQDTSSSKTLKVKAPMQLHVDKYLQDNVSSTRGVRQRIAQCRKRINKIDEIENKLKHVQHPTKTTTLSAGLLLRHSIGHFSGPDSATETADDDNTPTVERPAHHLDVAAKLETVFKSIQQKLIVLEQQKQKTKDAIAEISRTPAPELDEGSVGYRYTLRGFATKPNVTYVLRPIERKNSSDEDALIDTAADTGRQDDMVSETIPGHVWWRLQYSVTSSNAVQITKAKMQEDDVLRSIELEHHSALLVYCNDRVCAPIEDVDAALGLPEQLKAFIEKDNQHFRAELKVAARMYAPPDYPPPSGQHIEGMLVRPSIENDNGIERTSLDSTRANPSPSPPGYDSHEFLSHAAYGLPPDVKVGMDGESEEEVVEINLDEPSPPTEMTEKNKGAAFGVGGVGASMGSRGSDSTMVDSGSQDACMGEGSVRNERMEWSQAK